MEQKQTKIKLDLATILRDWHMVKHDGVSVGRVGPKSYAGRSDGEGEQLAATNHYVVQESFRAMHHPHWGRTPSAIQRHIERVCDGHLSMFGFGLIGLEMDYWRAFTDVVLEKAATGYKGVRD